MELLALLVMPSLMLSEIAHLMWPILICWLLWGMHLLESTAKRFKCPLDSQLIWIFPLFSKLHYYIYPCSNSINIIKIYLTNFHKICQSKFDLFWIFGCYEGNYKRLKCPLDFQLICSDDGTGRARGPLAPPICGRSVNPIPTGEGRLSPPNITGTPMFFTFRHHCSIF